MPQKTFILSLVTPAFLGDAAQRGEWRTPPLKALFRQWWRVLVFTQNLARGGNPGVKALREKEGETFGHAWLTTASGKAWFMRSPLRLALDPWGSGTMSEIRGETSIKHREVNFPVGALLYLGYGPLLYERGRGTVLKAPPALDAGSTVRLTVSWADRGRDSVPKIVDWLAVLVHWFGTVGGRSRNGWGSVQVFNEDGAPLSQLAHLGQLSQLFRPLDECLKNEWPAALGKDEKGPLVWWGRQTYSTWQEAMKELAEIKIDFRTALAAGAPGAFDERHLLAYPVTRHVVNAWGNQRRLANQLRFKVHLVQGAGGKPGFLPMAYHLPHRLPQELEELLREGDKGKAALGRQKDVWCRVHSVLDRRMRRATFGSPAAGGSRV